MAKTDTLILSFGVAVQTASGLMLVEIDPLVHKDADGNQMARFPQNVEVFFILHHDPRISIVRVNDTADGNVTRIAEVTRGGSQENVTFTHGAAEKSLSHIPIRLPSVSWYGRGSGLVLKNKNIVVATGAPCLGDLTYQYRATQYRYRPPEMSLALGEEFPVDMVIEYQRKK